MYPPYKRYLIFSIHSFLLYSSLHNLIIYPPLYIEKDQVLEYIILHISRDKTFRNIFISTFKHS